MSGTYVVQSGSSVGAAPAAAPKDGSWQSSEEAGGFASVLGQEDAASKASSSTGGAVHGKGHTAAHAPKFDPTRALFGAQGEPLDGDPKDAKAASKDGAGSTSDAPPADPEAGDDRDRHALAAVLIPGFAAPAMPPPPKVAPTSSTDPTSSPAAALDAADGAAQAAGLASLEAPLPGASAEGSSPSAADSATASSAGAPGSSAALPVQAAPLPAASLTAAQGNPAAAPIPPRPAASAPRTPARDPATASKPAEQASTGVAPSASSTTTAAAGGQAASPTHDPQAATAPGTANAPDAANPAGRALRQGTRGAMSRAGDPPTGGADRTGRGRGAASGGTDSGDPTSAQDAQATDPTAGPLPTLAAATPGSVDDGRAKTMTTVTKASPAADASPAATSARLRDALASVSNQAILRGPATGHIDVPDLGRIAVRAHTNNGSVDVDVTADHADARALLRGHVNGMTADLHQADVPVARVTVERGTAAFGDSQGSTARDPGANRQHSPRDSQASLDQDDESTSGDAGTAKRVRIVL